MALKYSQLSGQYYICFVDHRKSWEREKHLLIWDVESSVDIFQIGLVPFLISCYKLLLLEGACETNGKQDLKEIATYTLLIIP